MKFEPENHLDENIIDTDNNFNDLEDQEKRLDVSITEDLDSDPLHINNSQIQSTTSC